MEEMKEDVHKMNGKLRCFMNHLSHASDKLQEMFQPFIEVKTIVEGLVSVTKFLYSSFFNCSLCILHYFGSLTIKLFLTCLFFELQE